MCKRDAPKCVRIHLWPLRRDDSSRVLIGAAGVWRSDWRRRNVGPLIGQSACRLLAFVREAIDSTCAGALPMRGPYPWLNISISGQSEVANVENAGSVTTASLRRDDGECH